MRLIFSKRKCEHCGRSSVDLIESGTVFNPRRGEGWQGGTYNKTNTYQFAAGGRWERGPLRVTGDVARTNSTFTGSTESVDYVLCRDQFNCGQTVNFVIGRPGDIPSFELVGFDPTDPNNFSYRGLFEEAQQAKGKDWQGRADFEYQTGSTFLPKLQWGVRYVDRNASRVYGSRYNDSMRGTPIQQVPLDYELFSPGFRGADNPPFPTFWLTPTYSSIRNNIEELRLFSGYGTSEPPAYDPTASFRANEKSLAGYVQANWAFNLGGIAVDGQIGVRGIHANRNLHGTQRTDTGAGFVFTPVDDKAKETFWLPNINARMEPTPGRAGTWSINSFCSTDSYFSNSLTREGTVGTIRLPHPNAGGRLIRVPSNHTGFRSFSTVNA